MMVIAYPNNKDNTGSVNLRKHARPPWKLSIMIKHSRLIMNKLVG